MATVLFQTRLSFITRNEMLEIVNAIFIMVGETDQTDEENSPAQRVDLIFGRMDKVVNHAGMRRVACLFISRMGTVSYRN